MEDIKTMQLANSMLYGFGRHHGLPAIYTDHTIFFRVPRFLPIRHKIINRRKY